MQQIASRRALVIRFIILYIITLGVLVLVFCAFVNPAVPAVSDRQPYQSAPIPAAAILIPDTSADHEIEKLQAEIGDKNSTIALLQTQLKANKVKETATDGKELQRLKSELSIKTKQLTKLQLASANPVTAKSSPGTSAVRDLEVRNANLVKGFNSLQTQMGMLQKNYNLLKAENARLIQRLANARN